MSEKKDYLSMLAEEANAKKQPASFSEEKFERVEKPKINLDPKMIAGGVVALVVVFVAVYFLFLAPKIEMPNFVGKTKTDVSAWIKQEGISTSGIVMREEYNFDAAEGEIISQSVDAGKKVKSDAKITFVASLGADPDEKITFPDDVLALTRSDIQNWIDTNKLTGVKIQQSYSETVEEGYVISFDLKGVDKTDFLRSTNVTFTVSRGVQPAGTITVEDFSKKDLATVETFATSKKIVLDVVEVYSDDIASGLVVSQSVQSGKTMNQGDTLTIHVSKGKAVSIPNFSTYTSDMLEVWAANKDNNVTILKKEMYSDQAKGTIISQSIKAGSKVDQGSVLELTISLSRPKLQDTSRQWLGQDYLTLQRWVDETWTKGAKIEVGNWLPNVSTSAENPTPGLITQYKCMDKNGDELPQGCDGLIPIDGKIAYGKVEGEPHNETPVKTPDPVPTPPAVTEAELTADHVASLAAMKAFCNATQFACNFSDELNSETDATPVEVRLNTNAGPLEFKDSTTTHKVTSSDVLTITKKR